MRAGTDPDRLIDENRRLRKLLAKAEMERCCLHELLSAAGVSALVVDSSLGIHYATPAAEAALALPPAEQKRRLQNLPVPLDTHGIRESVCEVLRTHQVANHHMPTQDGDCIGLRIVPCEGDQPDPCVAMILDRTPTASPSESEGADPFSALLSAVPAAVLIAHDRGCHVVTCNEVAAEMFGIERCCDLAKYLTTADLHFEQDGHAIQQHMLPLQRCVREGIEVRNFDLQVRHSSGRLRYLFGHAIPLKSSGGEARGGIAVFLDTTEFRDSEERLCEAHGQLERRVQVRTRELEESYRKLQEQVLARESVETALIRSEQLAAIGTLAGGVAHEFNNINNSILGFVQLALLLGDLNPRAREYLERIARATQRAGRTTSSLLTFSGLRKGRRALADLNAILQESLALLEAELRQAEIEVACRLAPSVPVIVNTAEIGQVFFNILQNAQHALTGCSRKRIEIETCLLEDSAIARIHDLGCGMCPEEMKRIFTPFYTSKGEHADPASPLAHLRGTGLGLSVSQTIIHRHDGSIAVQSEPGAGSVFTIVLPAAEGVDAAPPLDPVPVPERADAPQEEATIVVVDDEEDTRDVLKAFLRRSGYRVFATPDGRKALDRIDREHVDVLITDLRMPGFSGEDLLARLAERPRLNRPAAIVITGRETEGLGSLEGLEVFSTLTKPVDLATIMQSVRQAALWRRREQAPQK